MYTQQVIIDIMEGKNAHLNPNKSRVYIFYVLIGFDFRNEFLLSIVFPYNFIEVGYAFLFLLMIKHIIILK